MKKVFSVSQIQEADRFTIENEPIESILLMERAAKTFVEQLKNLTKPAPCCFCIFCGPGNNGGDGAAIARLMAGEGYEVKVYLPIDNSKYSKDLATNVARLKEVGIQPGFLEEIDFDNILPSAILIDALFGSGLSKPMDGIYKEVVMRVNELPNIKIAIDIPSGLYTDKKLDNQEAIVLRADYTFTFQFPKLAFFFPENEFYIGEWSILDINLHEDFIQHEKCNHYMPEHEDFVHLYKPRHRFAHKGTYGHALLMGGSKGKIGAAVLMSKACIASGAGLVTTSVPACGLDILQISVPEVMAIPDGSNSQLTQLPNLSNYSAIAFGPGSGTSDETAQLLKLLIQQAKVPLVLDADALNILSENPTWLSFLPAGTVLTPHQGEFIRLVGKYSNSFERLEMLKSFCIRYKLFVILKGAYSTICTPLGNCYFNPSGNPGMATAGSGDTLTGIITGLLAMHYETIDACLLATYIHGLAGDIAAEEKGFESLTASNIIDNLGKAFLKVRSL